MKVCDKCRKEIEPSRMNLTIEEFKNPKKGHRYESREVCSNEFCLKCGKELIGLIKKFVK